MQGAASDRLAGPGRGTSWRLQNRGVVMYRTVAPHTRTHPFHTTFGRSASRVPRRCRTARQCLSPFLGREQQQPPSRPHCHGGGLVGRRNWAGGVRPDLAIGGFRSLREGRATGCCYSCLKPRSRHRARPRPAASIAICQKSCKTGKPLLAQFDRCGAIPARGCKEPTGGAFAHRPACCLPSTSRGPPVGDASLASRVLSSLADASAVQACCCVE